MRRRSTSRYPDAELVWCQEEPKNMGFWTFVQPRINTALRELLPANKNAPGGTAEVRYVGRPAAASPATGSPTIHAAETRAVIGEALNVRHRKGWWRNSLYEP